MKARALVKDVLARRGWELRRVTASPAARRQHLLRRHAINVVIDVGANAGQYAKALRASGYQGRIVSFEPLPDAFALLEQASSADPFWDVHNVALGPAEAEISFNVSRDGVCSSALAATEVLTRSVPQGTLASTISVQQVKLDDVVPLCDRAMLKIDTQGYEHQVLDGASELLRHVEILDIEMALVELYDGGSAVYDLLPRLKQAGFVAVSIDPGFVDPNTTQTLDVDVLMVRG